MDFLYGPIETDNEPTGFEPLEWDDEEYDEDDYYSYTEDPYEEDEYDEYEEPGLGGFDDLKPFGSFNDESQWDDAFF